MLSMASSSFYAKEVSKTTDSAKGQVCQWLTIFLHVEESVYQRVMGVIVFVADNIVRPVHSNDMPWLSEWYSQHSQVFVADSHSLWARTNQKISRRYGKVIRSSGVTLNEMVKMHEDEVFDWILRKSGLDDPRSRLATKGTEELVMSLEKPEI